MASFSSESVDSRPDLEFRGRATWKALLFFLLPHEAIVAAVRAGSGTLGIWFGQSGAKTQKAESPKWSKNWTLIFPRFDVEGAKYVLIFASQQSWEAHLTCLDERRVKVVHMALDSIPKSWFLSGEEKWVGWWNTYEWPAYLRSSQVLFPTEAFTWTMVSIFSCS